MKYLRELLERIGIELDRKTAASLLVLLLLLILLPAGLFLIKNQLTFFPKAAGELIQLGEGGCIKLNKDKKKVVDCPTVPLKLINPFFKVSAAGATTLPSGNASTNPTSFPTANPSQAASILPSPSASVTPAPQIIRVTGNTNVEIQAALDQIKDSGGAVYLPAGTYDIANNVRVYSNVTLFGDGIDQTILEAGVGIDEEEGVVVNDSSQGQSNVTIRDMTIKGHSLGSGEAVKLRNLDGGFVFNLKAIRINTGVLLGIHNGKGVKNVRVSWCEITQAKKHGVFLTLGETNVIDNCTIDSEGSDALGIGLEIAVDGKISGNRVISNTITNGGHSLSLTAGNDTQYQSSWVNSGNVVCYNSASGNKIDQIWDQRGTNNVYVGNNVPVNNVNSFGFEEKSGTDPRCDIPSSINIPPVPAKPQALKPAINYLAQILNDLYDLTRVKPVLAVAGLSGVTNNDCGTLISTPALHSAQGDIVYKAPIRAGNEWQTVKNDGTIIPQQRMQLQNLEDPRTFGTAFFGPDYINCTIFITYGDSGGCAVDPPPKGREGINGGKLSPGETVTLHVRPDLTPGQVSCNIQMQTSTLAASADSDDDFTGTSGDDSDDLFTDASQGIAAGTGVVRYRLAESQAGLSGAQWKEFAWITSMVGNVFAQDSDDDFTGTSGDDSDDVFTEGNGSMTGSSSPASSGGPASSGNPSFSIGKQFINTSFKLTNTTPGVKQIWVQYMHPDGSSRVDNVTFDLVDKTPQILGLACNLDVSKQNLKITVTGDFFGNAAGTATTVDPNSNLEILGWTNKEVIGLLKKPNIPINEGQRFKVKVVRPDGFESGTAVCAVNKSLISFGAKIFCREPGKFDASDVTVTLLYNPDEAGKNSNLSKVEEKVTISKDGEINNLKTQLQVGKNYAISVKAPNSLRRSTIFTAMEGTTEIRRPDGTSFILPVGDIAPVINTDGQINTLDRSELIRQWRVLGQAQTNTKLTGDFNRDGKVNSIDWACMQYDFGNADDPVPVEVPGSSSNTIRIPESNSGTIFIPVK